MNIKDFLKQAENWIENPVNNSFSPEAAIVIIQDELKKEGADKKTLGHLLGRIKSTQKALLTLELKDWVAIDEGHLAIGHRPSAQLMQDLKLQGTTHVFTLLSEKEGGKEIESLAKKHGLNWLWFPMESALAPDESRHDDLRKLFRQMKTILSENGKIYIHCSAGIHRTGMISLAFMNFLGFAENQSLEKLSALRTETSNHVGEERSSWGLRFT